MLLVFIYVWVLHFTPKYRILNNYSAVQKPLYRKGSALHDEHPQNRQQTKAAQHPVQEHTQQSKYNLTIQIVKECCGI